MSCKTIHRLQASVLAALAALLGCSPGGLAADPPAEVIRTLQPLSVRGFNYFPRETPWSGLWTKTPPGVWEADMALAASLGANTVRTFVPFSRHLEQANLVLPDGTPSPEYLEKIETLLAAAWGQGIRVILCFEFSPDWLAERGPEPRWKRALAAVVAAHRDDGRLRLWDLMNEPDDDAKWSGATQAYLRESLPLIRKLDPNHPCTVGIAYRIDRLAAVGLPDVLQYHEYCPKAQLFEQGTGRVQKSIAGQLRTGGPRALLIGEFGMSTARDPVHGAEESLRGRIGEAPGTEADQARLYELVLAAAEQERVAGVLAWCLHDYPIQNPNESHFGLVRSDGSLKPAALVLKSAFSRWAGF